MSQSSFIKIFVSRFSIIKAKNPRINFGRGQSKSLVLSDLEIVTPGDTVGVQLGSPVEIGTDGKIPVEAMLSSLR